MIEARKEIVRVYPIPANRHLGDEQIRGRIDDELKLFRCDAEVIHIDLIRGHMLRLKARHERRQPWLPLFTAFDACLAAQAEQPYNPDKVQALGMVFAAKWNTAKTAICQFLGEDPDDFSYVKWRDWVPRIRKALDRD